MANVDPETVRRRAERAARHRRRQEGGSAQSRYNPEEIGRRQQPSRWATQQAQLTESRLRQHDVDEPHIEHQPSLRSLLSASDADSHDVQAEILQSIYAEGLLDGLDIEHLTTEQEEQLTDRIAQAYRRRQRQRDHSRNRDPSRNSERRDGDIRPPPAPTGAGPASYDRNRSQTDVTSTQQQQFRSRPPVSRPHVFEQTLQEPSRNHGRSSSATSQRSNRSTTRGDGTSPAARLATVLSQQPSSDNTQRESRRRLSSTGRSVTDPQNGNLREQIHHHRTSSGNVRTAIVSIGSQDSNAHPLEAVRRRDGPPHSSTNSLPGPPPPLNVTTQHPVRPAISHAAFAPEPVVNSVSSQGVPSIKCNRCNWPDIQHDLHYNCRSCLDGTFNLCRRCYIDAQGCNHWFGFGFRAYDRWHRSAPPEGRPIGFDGPHVLSPRRYLKQRDESNQSGTSTLSLQEGAFCESCFTFANDCYWYCNICLEGAWGFCDSCVKQGRHCTHPLLLVAHISTLRQPHSDPTKVSFVGLPHLRQESYVTLSVTTHCDICHRPIPPNSARYHCYQCSNGDYDICNECYRGLVAQGKISQANGPSGWRRCLQGHRMALIGYQDTHEGGHLRINVREPVGGRRLEEDDISTSSQPPPNGYPPDGGVGMRCLALYNYLPKEGVTDELSFPKNAEIREVENKNGDWYLGVYSGTINLFPSNHVRIL